MAYKIVVDSCCDLTDEIRGWSNLEVVPLTLQIGDYTVIDDENFNQEDFISRMVASDELAKSACPSPDAFAKAIEGDEDEVYIITITDKLSGCYNSAMQGVSLFFEENEGSTKKVHVFDSKATAGLETLMAEKIKELADGGVAFDEIVKTVEDYCVNGLGLIFCLESMDALKGNGRLYNLAASVIEALRVKLICRRTQEGNISVAGKDLTVKRALNKLAALIAKETEGKDLTGKKCYITQVCCVEKANEVKQFILNTCRFAKENIIVLKASGLNSLYASNGGIIVSFES